MKQFKKVIDFVENLLGKIPPTLQDLIFKLTLGLALVGAVAVAWWGARSGQTEAQPQGLQMAKDMQDLFSDESQKLLNKKLNMRQADEMADLSATPEDWRPRFHFQNGKAAPAEIDRDRAGSAFEEYRDLESDRASDTFRMEPTPGTSPARSWNLRRADVDDEFGEGENRRAIQAPAGQGAPSSGAVRRPLDGLRRDYQAETRTPELESAVENSAAKTTSEKNYIGRRPLVGGAKTELSPLDSE